VIVASKDSPLAAELAFFEEQKSELLAHNKGQFALIKGGKLHGTFTTFEEAYKEGVRLFGNSPMLVRQVVEHAPQVRAPALMLGILRSQT
jgi:hypothetical protein